MPDKIEKLLDALGYEYSVSSKYNSYEVNLHFDDDRQQRVRDERPVLRFCYGGNAAGSEMRFKICREMLADRGGFVRGERPEFLVKIGKPQFAQLRDIRRACEIDGVRYESIAEAARAYHVSRGKMKEMIDLCGRWIKRRK